MKWSKRNEYGAGYLGQGYASGDYIIEETSNREAMQKAKELGGKMSNYYWVLKKNDVVIGYAKTAKALKQVVEVIEAE